MTVRSPTKTKRTRIEQYEIESLLNRKARDFNVRRGRRR